MIGNHPPWPCPDYIQSLACFKQSQHVNPRKPTLSLLTSSMLWSAGANQLRPAQGALPDGPRHAAGAGLPGLPSGGRLLRRRPLGRVLGAGAEPGAERTGPHRLPSAVPAGVHRKPGARGPGGADAGQPLPVGRARRHLHLTHHSDGSGLLHCDSVRSV